MSGHEPETMEALEAASRDASIILERLAQPVDGQAKRASRFPEPSQSAGEEIREGPEPNSVPCTEGTQGRTWTEEGVRELLEALPDGVVVIDPSGAIVLVNKQVEVLFGYRREELLGRPIETLVPERVRGPHVGYRQGYFANPKTRPLETNLDLFGRRKNGSEFPVEISLSPLRIGTELLAASIIRDVSQRKREEAKFRTLVENIPAVTFIAPLDDCLPELYVSPQIEKLLGFSAQEWLDNPILWYQQLHPDDRERWNQQFSPTCSSGEPFRALYRFLARDGRAVWVHGSANLVRDDEGMPLFLQGVAFDVTALKEAEDALRRANAELEQRVRERTEALVRSMAELQEKTDELELFAYHAVHDLKEPLTTMLTHTQRLDRENREQLSGKALERIGKITGGTTSMRQLLEKLREFAHVTRREESRSVDCSAAVANACANLQAAIDETAAEITVGELPTVVGMPEHLTLLFQNLISNGIKYRSPDRAPRISISAREHVDGWLFEVIDNGIGIESKYLKKIFLMGQRLFSRSAYEGWGYGLAICEKTVTRHGGRIWVTSDPGQGSCFCFTLSERRA